MPLSPEVSTNAVTVPWLSLRPAHKTESGNSIHNSRECSQSEAVRGADQRFRGDEAGDERGAPTFSDFECRHQISGHHGECSWIGVKYQYSQKEQLSIGSRSIQRASRTRHERCSDYRGSLRVGEAAFRIKSMCSLPRDFLMVLAHNMSN